MDSYHERLLKHDCMDQPQFNESYKAKHMFTTFPPVPPAASTFIQAARLTAQRRFEQDQRNANNGSNFGTQEDIHQSQ